MSVKISAQRNGRVSQKRKAETLSPPPLVMGRHSWYNHQPYPFSLATFGVQIINIIMKHLPTQRQMVKSYRLQAALAGMGRMVRKFLPSRCPQGPPVLLSCEPAILLFLQLVPIYRQFWGKSLGHTSRQCCRWEERLALGVLSGHPHGRELGSISKIMYAPTL